jgi:hypothetical protein
MIIILSVESYEFVGQYEGISLSVQCYGNYAYFNHGGNIQIADISNPDDIFICNSFHLGEYYCKDIEINNDIIFVATSNGTLLYSLTDPIHPQFASHINSHFTYNLIAQDSLLIAESSIYSISDPYQPVYLSSVDFSMNINHLYGLRNSILYGLTQFGYSGPQYILGYDISNPANPELISQLYLGSEASDPFPAHFEIYEDKLFIAVNDEMKMYDVSNEEEISFINSFPISENASVFKIQDNELYICFDNSGLFVIDISDDDNPVELGSFLWEAEFSDMDISNAMALISANSRGFKIVNTANLSESYFFKKTDTIWRLLAEDNLAYISSNEDGFQILDITDNQNHIEMGAIDFGRARKMEKFDNFVFFQCDSDSVLYIIDVSDSYHPTMCNQLEFSNYISDFCFDENKLYVIEAGIGIHLYDISESSEPLYLSFNSITGYKIAVENDLLFLASNNSDFPYTVKVKLYDIANISQFEFLDELILGNMSGFNIVEIMSDFPYFYVGTKTGLISGRISSSSQLIMHDLAIMGNLFTNYCFHAEMVYGTRSNEGLYIFNVSNIHNIEIENIIPITPHQVFREDDILYLANSSAGYVLYEISDSGTNPYSNGIEVPSKLLSNYPNPFNPTTTISFSIPEVSQVTLSIYNIKGQKVKTIVNDMMNSGNYKFDWNGLDEKGKNVSSGVYFYKLEINDKVKKVNKCLLLK